MSIHVRNTESEEPHITRQKETEGFYSASRAGITYTIECVGKFIS